MMNNRTLYSTETNVAESVVDVDEIPDDEVELSPEEIESGIYEEQDLPTDKANPDDDGDLVE